MAALTKDLRFTFDFARQEITYINQANALNLIVKGFSFVLTGSL